MFVTSNIKVLSNFVLVSSCSLLSSVQQVDYSVRTPYSLLLLDWSSLAVSVLTEAEDFEQTFKTITSIQSKISYSTINVHTSENH